jgi:hypothetical protein
VNYSRTLWMYLGPTGVRYFEGSRRGPLEIFGRRMQGGLPRTFHTAPTSIVIIVAVRFEFFVGNTRATRLIIIGHVTKRCAFERVHVSGL